MPRSAKLRRTPVIVDATGLACPLPVLKLQKAVRDAEPGALIELHATDPMAAVDVPHFCRQAGCVLRSSETTDGFTRFLVVAGTGKSAD